MMKKIFSDGWFNSLDDDFREEHELDVAVQQLLNKMKDSITPALYGVLGEMLQGFSLGMQLEMVDMMLDFMNDSVLKRTGCYEADYVLAQCYSRIGQETGIVDDDKVMDWFYSNRF